MIKNMENIRFRAWLPTEETMLFSDNQHDADPGFMEIWQIDNSGLHVEIQELYWISPGGNEAEERVRYITPEQHVMQFTGLTDKNDTKIFEGDILRFPAKNDWEELNFSCFEVFFHDGDSCGNYNIGYSMDRMYCKGSVCGGYIPSFKPKTVSRMIVIGNIHQNPELLKESEGE